MTSHSLQTKNIVTIHRVESVLVYQLHVLLSDFRSEDLNTEGSTTTIFITSHFN